MEQLIMMVSVCGVIFIILTCFFRKKYGKDIFYKKEAIENYSKDKFQEIYNKIDKNDIEILKKMQRQMFKWKIIILVCILVPLEILFIFARTTENAISIFIIIEVILNIFSISKYFKIRNKYVETFKEKIIANIIKMIDPNLRYSHQKKSLVIDKINRKRESRDIENTRDLMTAQKSYDMAKFDDEPYNIYYENDCIEGNLKEEMHIKMANIKTEQTVDTQEGTNIINRFEGMFVEARCNKNTKANIKIIKNKNSRKRTEMDNEEFEKEFDVITEDKILTMRILTHDVMETMMKFYDIIKYEIVIKDDRIYLRFFTGPMFEAKISNNVIDKESTVKYYSILNFIVEVTSKINQEIQKLEI